MQFKLTEPADRSFGPSRCRFGGYDSWSGFAWQNLVTNILSQSLEHALSEPCLHISRLCTRWVGTGSLSIDKMPCHKLVRQLRHHFGPVSRIPLALYHHVRAVCCALLENDVPRVLIGPWNPMV